PQSLFEAPTVARLARLVDDRAAAASPSAVPSDAHEEGQAGRPLSFGQRSLWFLAQLQADRADYNVCSAARLTGVLDRAILTRGLEGVAKRHQTLRTTFAAAGGRPRQIIAADPDVRLPLTDLRDLPAEARAAELQRLAAAETRRPFDLARGPCWRTRL